MQRMTKLVSFWAFVAFAALLALQAFPFTGIFLMILGGMLWTGLLLHVLLISLLVEALTRRVPRWLMIVPLGAYGAYYAAYLYQSTEIARTSAELKASNPAKVLDFDPAAHSLVTAEANTLVQRYAIPVAYEPNKNFQPEGYLSTRLIRRDQCDIRRDTQNRTQTFGVHWHSRFQKNVCSLRFPEAPPLKVVTAVQHGDAEVWKRKWGISRQVTELTFDGKVLGAYQSASVWRLSELPIVFIGCALISSTPAWKCGGDVKRSHITIDAVPAGADHQSGDSPTAIMLGLRQYTEADLQGFRGYASNDVALVRVAAEPARVEDEMFTTFLAMLKGENPNAPFNLGNAVAQNPDRLVPYSQAMAERFVALNRKDAPRVPQEQARTLATALASLPRSAFLQVADQIFGVVQQPASWDRYTALYIRAGDIGPAAFEFYKKDFMVGKFPRHLRGLPALAICRIGKADDETIAEMKRRFVDGAANGRQDDEYRSAIFVALLKLGEESFLRENNQSMTGRLLSWGDAILDGRGMTENGPNNCTSREGHWGPTMGPSLRWIRGAWSPRV